MRRFEFDDVKMFYDDLMKKEYNELRTNMLFSLERFVLLSVAMNFKNHSLKYQNDLFDFISILLKQISANNDYLKNGKEITPLKKAKLCLSIAKIKARAFSCSIGDSFSTDEFFEKMDKIYAEYGTSTMKTIIDENLDVSNG